MPRQAVAKVETLPSFDPEKIITKAIEQGVPIETMERLLQMRKELKAEMAREAYYAALSDFQSQCPVIKKTKEVINKSGSVRYKYSPLDDIIAQVAPILKSCGLSYSINTESKESGLLVTTTVHHIAGHSEASPFWVGIDTESFMSVAQKSGSALTYAKRYSFCNALGIITGDEDDDGQATGGRLDINDLYRKFCNHMAAVWENRETIATIKDLIEVGNLSGAAEAWFELDNDTKQLLWVAPTKGGIFTVDERAMMKSGEFHEAYYGSQKEVTE